jgi:thiol-disulfide isomerase/thioredoxin
MKIKSKKSGFTKIFFGKCFIVLLFLVVQSCQDKTVDSFSGIVKGKIIQNQNQEIRLEGFNGLNTYLIDDMMTDQQGNFSLSYSESDYGVGYLISSDEKPLIVILSGEGIEIKGETLSLPETIKILKGKENILFEQYAKEHPLREQALSAWDYLSKMYAADSLFSDRKKPVQAIKEEITRIKQEDDTFLANLPENSFVSWLLPIRKLVSSVSVIAQYRTEEIPTTIQLFRTLDYTDPKLYKSGLFRDAIESHFWLLENSGKPLDHVFSEMKISIDSMNDNLIQDEKKYNEVMDYLFDLLERHSLFEASEYLAVKVLNQKNCTLNSNLAKQLETYRAMKKGNVAPDFNFVGDIINPIKPSVSRLSDITSNYTLVVFAASWCPKCTEEIPQLVSFYTKWKSQGLEIVTISLDEDQTAFNSFFGQFPFTSICDYKKWDGPIVTDYYIFSTPTMFLLNKKREILLRPNSAKQVEAWLDWVLISGS